MGNQYSSEKNSARKVGTWVKVNYFNQTRHIKINEGRIFPVKYLYLMIYCRVHSTEEMACDFLNISIKITSIKCGTDVNAFVD